MTQEEKFQNSIDKFKKALIDKKTLFERISLLRLITFIIAIISAIFAVIKNNNTYLVISMVMFIVFVLLVIKHNVIKNQLQEININININQRYVDRINGKWVEFKENGEEFMDDSHPYSSDLDIFGHKSIYQMINTANTFYGRDKLKAFLKNPKGDIQSIKSRQKAVKELADKLDFCRNMQREGMKVKQIKDNPDNLIEFMKQDKKLINNKTLLFFLRCVPIVTVIALITAVLGLIQAYIPIILIIIQALTALLLFSGISRSLNTVYDIKAKLQGFSKLIKLIEEEKFEGEFLNEIKNKLYINNKPASSSIKSLERIGDAIDIRYGQILYIILNILLLWDLQCLFALEEWRESEGKYIENWFHSVADFEALSSLSVLLQINPKWTMPDIYETGVRFMADEMGHPLITEARRVNNSINIENSLCVVTGSNMSGKTTLLRTIGINLVLAYAGAPVCAAGLKCSIMNIFTSMRIKDDLNEGISTFYAELLRIKMIIEFSHNKKPMIFLIDEIFRGTNSRDRIIGAKNVLKNLSKSWIIGLISTHDFELCELEKEGTAKIINYHFTESYLNDKIKFDYKLKNGRSTTTNATYLMKMVGIEIAGE